MMKDMVWALPDNVEGVIESIKLTELGNVMVKFRLGSGDEATFVNYNVARIEDLLAKCDVFNLKSYK